MKRPSHATVVAYIALFFAMSGTAVAATGGTFILGKSNAASATTSLTNSAGTALKLTSKSGYPPFSAGSNKVKVPYLNSDLLDGLTSASFLRSTGKAADANLLDGVDSAGFLRSTGQAVDANLLDGLDSTSFQRATSVACSADSFVQRIYTSGSVYCADPVAALKGLILLSTDPCPANTFALGARYLSDSSGQTRYGYELCVIL